MKFKIFVVFSIFMAVVQSIPHKLHPRAQKLGGKARAKSLAGEGSYRLPTTSHPISYDVKLVTHLEDPNPLNKIKFEGSVRIKIRVVNDTKDIVLHKKGIIIEKPVVLYNGVQISTLYQDEENDYDFLTISNYFTVFTANSEYEILINFGGELRDDNLGFYQSTYINENNETIWIATTQFESVEARTVFPCYDEPGIRATFKISITHGLDFTAISNMDGVRNPNTTFAVTEFEATPPVQTYLIAFIISDFKSVSTNSYAKIPQRVFAKPKSVDAGEADVALRLVGSSLSDNNDYDDFLDMDK